MHSRSLYSLLLNLIELPQSALYEQPVTGISNNTQSLIPGNVFVAIPGYATDGHDFIDKAVDAGASAVIGEREIEGLPVPYFKTDNARQMLARLAKRFYREDSKHQIMIGVTGTNGKTTTSFMIKHILEQVGYTCSLFGSVHNIVNGLVSSSTNTTLDALELNKQLAQSQDDVVIMEVSSHALSQYRVEGIHFDYALFTNLSQDHLDYHHTMEAYFATKKRLFSELKQNAKSVINTYDVWGKRLAESPQLSDKHLFMIGEAPESLSINKINFSKPMTAHLSKAGKDHLLRLHFYGEHNVYNAAMAFLTTQLIGVKESDILKALATFEGVPGRFEVVENAKGTNFVIDYAHTEDAFFHCLHTANQYGAKRIFHIFGFRGGRDESKRQAMVDTSKGLCDIVILTLDDLNNVPYKDMVEALHSYDLREQDIVIPDRVKAIEYAWHLAGNRDWVFVTGKGHEVYQQRYTTPVHSDREAIEHLLENNVASTRLRP